MTAKPLTEYPSVAELMPLTYAGWQGQDVAASLDELRAEDVAYGEYMLTTDMESVTMFERRCTAAAHKQRHKQRDYVAAIVAAISKFDLSFIGITDDNQTGNRDQ